MFKDSFPPWLLETLPRSPYFWNINSFDVSPPRLKISGWALPWDGVPNNKSIWLKNNTKLSFTDEKAIKLSTQFPYWPNADFSLLEAATDGLSTQVIDDDHVTLLNAPRSQAGWEDPRLETFAQWLYLPLSKTNPVPPDNLIAHIGKTSADFFRLSGCTLFNGFRLAAERFCGKPFHQLQNVLDWGCGPARIATHALTYLNRHNQTHAYFGADIDRMAIEWATREIGNNFLHVGLSPPLPYNDDFFEFVFGYSVFSHLDLNNQGQWLSELSRICTPKGVIAVTVMSELAMFFTQPHASADSIRAWRKSGIYDSQPNDQLTEAGVSGDYYRNVWLTKEFIQNNWSRDFDILGIYPNFHFYQDLVVLRPKK